MSASAPVINLDKLRNAVQKYGAMSFTSSQLAEDYHQGEANAFAADPKSFEDLLRRHAPLLGIQALPSSAGGDTVWQPL